MKPDALLYLAIFVVVFALLAVYALAHPAASPLDRCAAPITQQNLQHAPSCAATPRLGLR